MLTDLNFSDFLYFSDRVDVNPDVGLYCLQYVKGIFEFILTSKNFESKIVIILFAYVQGFQEVDHLNSFNQQTSK